MSTEQKPEEFYAWGAVTTDSVEAVRAELQNDRLKNRRKAQLVLIVGTLTALTMWLALSAYTASEKISLPVGQTEASTSDLQKLHAIEVKLDQMDVAVIKLAAQSQTPGSSAATRELIATQKDQGRRLSAIEGAILTSPENALSVPLIRNELEAFKKDYSTRNEFIRAELDRLYSVSKWILGGIATLIMSIGTWLLTTLIAGRDKKS